MKKQKMKILIYLLSSLIVFTSAGGVILTYTLPDEAHITPNETHGKWLPPEYGWMLRTDEENVDPVWLNNQQKNSKLSNTQTNATIYYCGFIPIKNVSLNVVNETFVIPGGQSIGISLKPPGILVTGLDKVYTANGEKSPALDAGIRSGDIITKINQKTVTETHEVSDLLKNTNTTLSIEGIRDGAVISWRLNPVCDNDGIPRAGMWIRDTISGIGTVTFYNSSYFAALGHPICDADTGTFTPCRTGSAYNVAIIGVDKGQKGSPGSLKGIFTGGKIGEITQNTQIGVYGTAVIPDSERIAISKKNQIRCGDAQIRCDIGNGVQYYDAKIIRIISDARDSKGIVIEITDKELLQKTGGIVQGMSGSPIIQNGKLIGAVTHVFVNDPTRGYGIFIENMLAETWEIR